MDSKHSFSRRGVLTATALGLAGGILMRSHAAFAKHKMAQTQVQYQDKPKDGHQCSGCRHFQAPNSCEIVAGTIAAEGWCMMWSPKPK